MTKRATRKKTTADAEAARTKRLRRIAEYTKSAKTCLDRGEHEAAAALLDDIARMAKQAATLTRQLDGRAARYQGWDRAGRPTTITIPDDH